jgi:uncharacterized protein (DUF2461 family)
MDQQFSHLLQLGRRGAERRLGELMNELKFLVVSFPHLSDAFDVDGLSLSFIIKRDARAAKAKTPRRHRSAQAAARITGSRRLATDGRLRRRGE